MAITLVDSLCPPVNNILLKGFVMKKKILYLMHVDWHWIKQRPHFLAEELSSEFDVLVVYPRANNRSHLVENKSDLLRVPMLQLPFARFKLITFLNGCIKGVYFWFLMLLFKPNVVWFTFPAIIPQVVLKKFGKAIVVYDCMDDASEFTSCDLKRKIILHKEQVLLERADLVFVSSQSLREKILEKGICLNNLELVRNAFGGLEHIESGCPPVANGSISLFKILFFGAIGDHLDFDVLLNCLEKCKGVGFHFIGPLMVHTPKHERLKLHKQVEHTCLAALMRPYDCFIMPFKINKLIQSVDPVKLYEYINFNKNIICPYYSEIERFSEFVFFYRNKDELVTLVNNLMRDNQLKYNEKQRRLFLQSNNWNARGVVINKILMDKLLLNSQKVLGHVGL